MISHQNKQNQVVNSKIQNEQVLWGKQQNYQVVSLIGKGKYSIVFEGIHLPSSKKVAIKILKRIRKQKIIRQIRVLTYLDKVPGIVRLHDVIRDMETKSASLVLQLVHSTDVRKTIISYTPQKLRKTLFDMVTIIKDVHAKGIMHRDIKPINFLISASGAIKLTDFGLAQWYQQGKQYNTHVASRYYKSPDLLLGYKKYTPAIDMWAFGVMLAGFIFRKQPFFMADDNSQQLDQIVKVLGTQSLASYSKQIGITLTMDLVKNINSKVKFDSFITPQNKKYASPQAISLIQKLLVFDHKQRLTALQTLSHPYFSEQIKKSKK